MKRLLLSAAALTAFAAQPALAQSTDLSIVGTVPALCSTGMPASMTMPLDWISGGSIIDANGEFQIALPDDVPAAALVAAAAGQGHTVQDAWCNGINSTISYTLTPLRRTDGEVLAAGFVSHVGLSSTLTLGGQALTAEALTYNAVGGISAQPAGVFAGGLGGSLHFHPPADGIRLVAGDYEATASITLAPVG